MRTKIFFCFPALVLMLCFAISANGQVPQLINYQGQLNDEDGNPRNGTFDFEFRIYGAQTGGSSLWSETQNNITTNPTFNVLLGSVTTIPSNLFNSTSRFLEVRVNGDLLSPRQQFASVPYAFTSGSGSSVWLTSGNNVFRSSGKVGIGTANPRDPLGIRAQGTQEGLISFEDPNGNTKWHLEQNFGGNTPGLNFVETGVKDFRLFIGAGGNVGIGTGNPNFRLDVRGTIGNNATQYHSDKRWKKKIHTISQALDKVSQLRGVGFEWRIDQFKEMNFTAGKQIGVIAQEIEGVVPEIVSSNQQGFKSVDYAKLTALLIEAVKELKDENKAMRNRIETLEERMIANKGLVSNSSAKID